jgi:hypothetical protein
VPERSTPAEVVAIELKQVKGAFSSLDDLIGGGQQRLRDCEAEGLGGFEVDYPVSVFFSLLNREKNREFRENRPKGLDSDVSFVGVLNDLPANSLRYRTGNFFRRTGNCLRETGKLRE